MGPDRSSKVCTFPPEARVPLSTIFVPKTTVEDCLALAELAEMSRLCNLARSRLLFLFLVDWWIELQFSSRLDLKDKMGDSSCGRVFTVPPSSLLGANSLDGIVTIRIWDSVAKNLFSSQSLMENLDAGHAAVGAVAAAIDGCTVAMPATLSALFSLHVKDLHIFYGDVEVRIRAAIQNKALVLHSGHCNRSWPPSCYDVSYFTAQNAQCGRYHSLRVQQLQTEEAVCQVLFPELLEAKTTVLRPGTLSNRPGTLSH